MSDENPLRVNPVTPIPEQLPTPIREIVEAGKGGKKDAAPQAQARTEGYDLSQIPSTQKQEAAIALLEQPLLNRSEALGDRENDLKKEKLAPLKAALERLRDGSADRSDMLTLRQGHDVVQSLIVEFTVPNRSTPVVHPSSSELRKEINEFNTEARRQGAPERGVQLA